MKLKYWIGCSLLAAWTVPASPTRGPFGCFPVRLTVQSNVDELTLRLSGNAQAIATHESPRTTKLYDRTKVEITLDEIEWIRI